MSLNTTESLFFTVGCEKARVKEARGHGMCGYLEFALNYVELVQEPQFYFKLFYAFNQWYWKQKPEAARYQFELEPAYFAKAQANGFTVTVWIITAGAATEEVAQKSWESGLNTLIEFLVHGTTLSGDAHNRIYK